MIELVDEDRGEWVATAHRGRRMTLFAHLTRDQRQRLSGDATTGDEKRIDIVGSFDCDRTELTPFGSSYDDRLERLDRLTFNTPEEADRRAVEPIGPEDVNRLVAGTSVAGAHVLQVLAEIVIQAPYGRPIRCRLGEVPGLFPPWTCHSGGYDDQNDRSDGLLREWIADDLRRRGRPVSDGSVLAYLRTALSDRWTLGVLSDVGVSIELDGDDVRFTFDDPCHAHRARLGRPPL